MMYIPVLLFGVAALGGATLVTMRSSGKGMPMPLAAAHGLFAAAGLISLAVNVLGGGVGTLMIVSLILFLVVAMGGGLLFSFHLRKKPVPVALIYVHALGAIASYVMLIVSIVA